MTGPNHARDKAGGCAFAQAGPPPSDVPTSTYPATGGSLDPAIADAHCPAASHLVNSPPIP